jgi:hypothetical protein
MHSFVLELKWQTAEWQTRISPQKTAQLSLDHLEVTHTVLHSSEACAWPSHVTPYHVNGTYYKALHDKVKTPV